MLGDFFTGGGSAQSLSEEFDFRDFNKYSANSYHSLDMEMVGRSTGTDEILVWAVVGLDWNSGLPVFSQILGTHLKYNSFYAGTAIGPDESIVSGTIMGFYKVTNVDRTCNKKRECKKGTKKGFQWDGDNKKYAKSA